MFAQTRPESLLHILRQNPPHTPPLFFFSFLFLKQKQQQHFFHPPCSSRKITLFVSHSEQNLPLLLLVSINLAFFPLPFPKNHSRIFLKSFPFRSSSKMHSRLLTLAHSLAHSDLTLSHSHTLITWVLVPAHSEVESCARRPFALFSESEFSDFSCAQFLLFKEIWAGPFSLPLDDFTSWRWRFKLGGEMGWWWWGFLALVCTAG